MYVLTQSCRTLFYPMDYSPPGSSVHGIFPGKTAGVGCHLFLQGIFPTQRLNPCLLPLLHWQADTLPLSHVGSPIHIMFYITNIYKAYIIYMICVLYIIIHNHIYKYMTIYNYIYYVYMIYTILYILSIYIIYNKHI